MTQNNLWTLFPHPLCEIQSSCWMTCSEALCYGLFSSYPVISLAFNSIPGPGRGEGKLSTGTRCLLFLRRQQSYCSGSQMRHYMQVHVWMYVLQVVTGVSGNKNEQTWNYCICFSQNCAWETRDSCLHICVVLQGSLQCNEIITLIEMSPFLLIKTAASGQQWKSLVNTQKKTTT